MTSDDDPNRTKPEQDRADEAVKALVLGEMSPDAARAAQRFFASERDANWPVTAMQKRMQGTGR